MIELIDYGGGNVGSVIRCLHRLEIPFRMAGPDSLPSGDRPMILPGVGAFGSVMRRLSEGRELSKGGLADRIKALVAEGTPYLGICVGLQVLLDESTENPGVPGLGLIPGKVVKFTGGKIPQIGWNSIHAPNGKQAPDGYVYFVNSYYAAPADPSVVLYEANYNGPFCAAIQKDNITAFQFHPEKSGHFGHELFRRWFDAV